jgi:hypothetical protein
MCVKFAVEQRPLLEDVEIGNLGKPGRLGVSPRRVTHLVTESEKRGKKFAAKKNQAGISRVPGT